MQTGLFGEQPRDGGFADTGWPPEDERGEACALEHAREQALRSEQMILTDNGIERGRAQPFGEGHRAARRGFWEALEQIRVRWCWFHVIRRPSARALGGTGRRGQVQRQRRCPIR